MMMKLGSIFRTLFKCSHHELEIEDQMRRDEERRRRLRTEISKATESISHRAREVEAGSELVTILKKEFRQ